MNQEEQKKEEPKLELNEFDKDENEKIEFVLKSSSMDFKPPTPKFGD